MQYIQKHFGFKQPDVPSALHTLLVYFPEQHEVGAIIKPTLQMRKWRHRLVKQLACDYRQSWDWNPRLSLSPALNTVALSGWTEEPKEEKR